MLPDRHPEDAKGMLADRADVTIVTHPRVR